MLCQAFEAPLVPEPLAKIMHASQLTEQRLHHQLTARLEPRRTRNQAAELPLLRIEQHTCQFSAYPLIPPLPRLTDSRDSRAVESVPGESPRLRADRPAPHVPLSL